MATQSEQQLENNLVQLLEELGYSYVKLNNEKDLLHNLKTQLETHNQTTFTHNEFERILNHLNKGSVFDRAETLRDKLQLTKDNGEETWIEFIQKEHWYQNQYQVIRQVTNTGSYQNRYDVTLLINGLPLVQIELKRRGLELKEAFNQINRYHKHSFWGETGLFQYIQIFVISNGVNSKYYANNKTQNFKQTFFWNDINNKAITDLEAFTTTFLEPCHISKMICQYIVLHQTRKIPMVFRPYQYYAVEALLHHVENSTQNGYIWHTTGSGKTLTAFKASQILSQNPKVAKVVFVVDRKDLDTQTLKEFNAFCKGSVDASENTRSLVTQLSNDRIKLTVTTIQKLNNAIQHTRYLDKMAPLKDKNIIFIFDECHRSQFGLTHARIKKFFVKARMFGFTGTPIFAENAVKNEQGKRTTRELFDVCLHKYVITDAIRDENVLKFSIEYIGKYTEKKDSQTNIDIEVEGIDTQELLDSRQRLAKISRYILDNHARKTHGSTFNALFCISSIDVLIQYYQLFKEQQAERPNKLKIATIFSYQQNEEEQPGGSAFPQEVNPFLPCASPLSRDYLEEFIQEYNQLYHENFTSRDSQSFYDYYRHITQQLKDRKIDILLVVDMLLTGFDSPDLNTLYVDKNLSYHGLLQAFSRTNRIHHERKSHGNIVCFRNLKEATDKAITLFANKDAQDIIIIEPYESYVQQFNSAVATLLTITPTVASVNDLPSEKEELQFIRAFRDLLRLKNVLTSFVDFAWWDLHISEQTFWDYKSKYLDLYDKVKGGMEKEKVSILDDVDFQLELLHRDEINVSYILKLLAQLIDTPGAAEGVKKTIMDLLEGELALRSKRELIKKFIEENLIHIKDSDDIPDEFNAFMMGEKAKALETICREESLSTVKFQKLLDNFYHSNREPLRDDALDMLIIPKPGIRERKTVGQRIINKFLDFVKTFMDNVDI